MAAVAVATVASVSYVRPVHTMAMAVALKLQDSMPSLMYKSCHGSSPKGDLCCLVHSSRATAVVGSKVQSDSWAAHGVYVRGIRKAANWTLMEEKGKKKGAGMRPHSSLRAAVVETTQPSKVKHNLPMKRIVKERGRVWCWCMLFFSCLGLANSSVEIWVFGEENWKRNPNYVLVSTENGLLCSNVCGSQFPHGCYNSSFQFGNWEFKRNESLILFDLRCSLCLLKSWNPWWHHHCHTCSCLIIIHHFVICCTWWKQQLKTGTWQWSYEGNQLNIHYVEHSGSEGRPSKTLLLLPSLSDVSTTEEWQAVAETLVKQSGSDNWRAVVVDWPGLGLSDRPPIEYTVDVLEKFLIDLVLDANGPLGLTSGCECYIPLSWVTVNIHLDHTWTSLLLPLS